MCLVPGADDGPVDEGPEGGEVGGASVLVVEVVGVLPDVEGEYRLEAVGDGVAGAGLLGDGERAVRRGGEPDPAGAEEPDAFGDEVVLEGVEGAPLFHDLEQEGGLLRGGDRVCRGAELGEIQVVVEDLAGVVEDSAVRLLDDFLQGEVLVGAAREEFVQVVDIGLEVLAVVESDGTGADHRLECISCVRELYKRKHNSGI